MGPLTVQGCGVLPGCGEGYNCLSDENKENGKGRCFERGREVKKESETQYMPDHAR